MRDQCCQAPFLLEKYLWASDALSLLTWSADCPEYLDLNRYRLKAPSSISDNSKFAANQLSVFHRHSLLLCGAGALPFVAAAWFLRRPLGAATGPVHGRSGRLGLRGQPLGGFPLQFCPRRPGNSSVMSAEGTAATTDGYRGTQRSRQHGEGHRRTSCGWSSSYHPMF